LFSRYVVLHGKKLAERASLLRRQVSWNTAPMRHLLTYRRRMQLDGAASLIGEAACLALPLALLHARAVAEILIGTIDVMFLAHAWVARDDAAFGRRFTWAAMVWWVWLVICSTAGSGLLLGILAIRLPLLAVALGDWLLVQRGAERRRRWLWIVLAAGLAWVAAESWQQYLTGTNLFGQQRWLDGALTGPFNKPRAGPAFILLLFPVVIPAVSALLAGSRGRQAGGLALTVLAVLTLVLIGQRMPVMLMGLGLCTTALLLPRLRVAVLASGALGGALLAALPVVSPETYAKLVVRFTDQMQHFATSDYGLIFVRAIAVMQLHPWIGLGFDGFRRGCRSIWAMHGIDWLGIPTSNYNGGFAACNLHPHNYYLEAADNAGLPGLLLFVIMVAAALVRLAQGLALRPQGLRVGLFVGALVALWPVASTSAFTSMPNGGWVFLLLGFGFAVASTGRDRAAGFVGNAGRTASFDSPGRKTGWL
jgi:hypothetical protein